MAINIKDNNGNIKMKIADDLDTEDIIITDTGKEVSYDEAVATAEDTKQKDSNESERTDESSTGSTTNNKE